MVELCVEPYCHKCQNFKEEVVKNYAYYGGNQECLTEIRCENRDICENIRKYLEKK